MPTTPAAGNRVVLGTAGILLILGAAVATADRLGATDALPAQLRPGIPHRDTVIADIAAAHQSWLLPAAAALALLAVLLGALLLRAQLPARRTSARLQISDPEGRSLASLEPAVLEHALEDRLEGVPGIRRVDVRASGSVRELRLRAVLETAPDAELRRCVPRTRQILHEDSALALGTAPRAVDVLVRVAPAAPRRRDASLVPGVPGSAHGAPAREHEVAPMPAREGS
ncbi:hypothetical protein [Brachybacterium hainanense]|uniref:Alkaline shock response membrane anchor protein AmaP n=1 Tax=Brachybacterium hainanense TaxID=1541174 RepID=A0ABV6RGC1_9MICO